jgi:hypothetical protein
MFCLRQEMVVTWKTQNPVTMAGEETGSFVFSTQNLISNSCFTQNT